MIVATYIKVEYKKVFSCGEEELKGGGENAGLILLRRPKPTPRRIPLDMSRYEPTWKCLEVVGGGRDEVSRLICSYINCGHGMLDDPMAGYSRFYHPLRRLGSGLTCIYGNMASYWNVLPYTCGLFSGLARSHSWYIGSPFSPHVPVYILPLQMCSTIELELYWYRFLFLLQSERLCL